MKDFIAVFDSGIGGLTVYNTLKEKFPKENIVYLADSKNCPYGIKTIEEINRLSVNNINYLKNLGAKIIVIACNTATSSVKKEIIESKGQIVGVIEPTANLAYNHAILAQLGTADMRVPIQYALTWPERIEGPATPLDMYTCPNLTFGRPDLETFRCLALAMKSAKIGGTATAILNGANEAAVPMFLSDRISFLDIARLVEGALERVPVVYNPSLEDILAADEAARSAVNELLR